MVESPAKANTIKKYLGAGYTGEGVGGARQGPAQVKTMGIDIENDFAPEYEVIEGKKKVLAEIKSAAKKAERVYLAPDPDREGEAIAWHIAEELRPSNPNIQRVLFNEITKKAVNEAHPAPACSSTSRSTSRSRRAASSIGWSATRSARSCGPR